MHGRERIDLAPGFFFTGTDTGVGKTTVMAAAARALRRQGHRVRVSKPVATGASTLDGRLLAEDTLLLARAAGDDDRERITPWTFAEPAAPPVAARCVGQSLELGELAAAVQRRYLEGTLLLVEGVGGLLCPLTETATVADLAVELGLPLVIVARRSLGTLNHTLLTLEAAQRRNLRIAGVVVNETEPVRSLAEATNVAELAKRIAAPILAVVPHAADVETLTLDLDWQGLIATNLAADSGTEG